MSKQRCENISKIRLTRTTIQHNEEAGMRDNDLHRQRLQQRTERLAVVGLKKGELFVLRKTVWFALTKAGCFVLRKTVWFALIKACCFVLRKTVFSPSERRICRFEKSGFSVLRTVGCVLRGAKASTRIGGSPM
jgi:hypothetical protein